MTMNDGSSGVSNCSVFKSRLQEYTQKHKVSSPVYEIIREGPSHKSSFQSIVIVNGVRYNSDPGFSNRKAAEQSAAEVALNELNQCVSQPVHETGLFKNLLQEYAQKMNYAVPLYNYQNSETFRRVPQFTCTIEIGGIKYTGAASKSKKEAERSAGRTALLVIESESESDITNNNSQLTVLPFKKRTLEEATGKETIETPKAKKARKETIETPQPTEDYQNDQLEDIDIESILNLDPSFWVDETFESMEIEANQSECNLDNYNTQLSVLPSFWMNGFEESVEIEANQSECKSNLDDYNTQLTVLPCEKKALEEEPVKETIKTPKAKNKKKKKKRKGKRQVAKDGEDIINLEPSL